MSTILSIIGFVAIVYVLIAGAKKYFPTQTAAAEQAAKDEEAKIAANIETKVKAKFGK